MRVSNPASSFTGNPVSPTSSNTAGNGTAPSFQSLLGQLTNYVNETPAQRMYNAILAQLGITPQQLQSMSPSDREKVEEKVREMMKKEVQAQQQQQQQQELQAQMQQPASLSKTPSSSKHDIPLINLSI
jgi:sulfite reductase alpha subunit-like flavoprotein